MAKNPYHLFYSLCVFKRSCEDSVGSYKLNYVFHSLACCLYFFVRATFRPNKEVTTQISPFSQIVKSEVAFLIFQGGAQISVTLVINNVIKHKPQFRDVET